MLEIPHELFQIIPDDVRSIHVECFGLQRFIGSNTYLGSEAILLMAQLNSIALSDCKVHSTWL